MANQATDLPAGEWEKKKRKKIYWREREREKEVMRKLHNIENSTKQIFPCHTDPAVANTIM